MEPALASNALGIAAFLLALNVVLFAVFFFAVKCGALRGPQGFTGSPGCMGAMGEPATIIRFIGVLRSLDDLPGDPEHADCYIVDGRYMVYSDIHGAFQDAGPVSRA